MKIVNEWHSNQPLTKINDKCDYMFNTLTSYNYKEKRFDFYIDYKLRGHEIENKNDRSDE
jgi:hypothetical protein